MESCLSPPAAGSAGGLAAGVLPRIPGDGAGISTLSRRSAAASPDRPRMAMVRPAGSTLHLVHAVEVEEIALNGERRLRAANHFGGARYVGGDLFLRAADV